jgi:hypothetical protein
MKQTRAQITRIYETNKWSASGRSLSADYADAADYSVKDSGEPGHPFHVVDDDLVILSLDHPFIPEGRFASLMVRDQELARRLAEGFEKLWAKAMKDLREIDFQPPG